MGFTIFLGILLGIVALGLILFAVLRHKLRVFSKKAFGTPDIASGLSRAQLKAENTPRSLSGGDAIYTAQIKRDFPEFDIPLAKSQAQNCILDFLTAVEKGDASSLHISYAEKIAALAQSIIDDGKTVTYDALKFHNTTISRYLKSGNDRTVKFQTAFEYRLSDGQKTQQKYELDYTYYLADTGEASSASLRCGYCGAPVGSLGDKACAYCGSAVEPVQNKTWRFTNLIIY